MVRDTTDPGDATQRNFRYQHAYGVMLLVAARRGLRPYVAVWCEHHEDLLAERLDGRYDGYQVKTSRPENGAWRLTDEELVKSVGRFVDLVAAFGEAIGDLFFVSNTEMDMVGDAVRDQVRRGRCPGLFLTHVRTCATAADVAAPFDAAFGELTAACGCTADQLFDVLRRMDVIVGPSRQDIDASLAHEHLAALSELTTATAVELDHVRSALTAAVFRASSLQVTDPMRHLRPLTAPADGDPVLAAKRIAVATLDLSVAAVLQVRTSTVNGAAHAAVIPAPTPFRFPGEPTLTLAIIRPDVTLRRKLTRGGLDADVADDLAEKGRAAEAHLLEDLARRPHLYPGLLKQLESVVLSECLEAYLRAQTPDRTFARPMLIDVQDRMRRLAAERPHMVGGHEPECLLGVAGMLTADCRVWWSERFPVEEAA